MADELSASAPTPVTASVAQASSPTTAAPAASAAPAPTAPVSTATPAPSAPVTPAATTNTNSPAPVATSSADVAAATQPAVIETILGTDKPADAAQPAAVVEPAKADAAKPADVKAPDAKEPAKAEDAKIESSQTADPAPLPTYEPFVVPEGITLDDKKLGEFTKKLGEIQLATKADQAVMQKFGQEMVEAHIADTTEVGQRLAEHYSKAWEKQTNDWFEAFSKDPEIGDKKFETTKKSVLTAVNKYAGNETQTGEFKKFMNETGVGNHPSLIRLINNMQGTINAMQEKYETERGVKPLAGTKPAAEKKGFLQTMYGNLK